MSRRWFAYAAAAPPLALFGQMYWVRHKFRLPPDAQGPLTGTATPPAGAKASSAAEARRQRHIVFLGDSLVTGVGCSVEASQSQGPVLPRRVAEVLAQQLGEQISWTALGETGADVRMLQNRLLPSLKQEVTRVEGEGQHVDAVVIMTGLNDIKECFLFAQPSLHPWRFGELMGHLLSTVCDLAGGQCALVVTGVPIDAVPRFNELWPLSSAVKAITKVWEAQKQFATETEQQAQQACVRPRAGPVAFLDAPPWMKAEMQRRPVYFASDGMHPNDAGYTVWGDIIAERLLLEWRPEVQWQPPQKHQLLELLRREETASQR